MAAAAALTLQLSFSLLAASDSSSPLSRLGCLLLRIIRNRNQHLHLTLSLLLLLSFIVFSLYSRKAGSPVQARNVPVEEPDVDKVPELEEIEGVSVPDPTRISNSFLLEISEGEGNEAEKKRKKKKRARKKRPDSNEELVCLYPFTTSSSATQRRIKQHYDELVRCHGSKASSVLKLAQVEQFANCLIETRNELQHKSEVIQRRFTITKALLYRADRSSLDRLRQQIYKLELEQKRLEEDAFVYNWLQQQLKLSPAYKKMIEIGACVEAQAKSGEVEDGDEEFADISFEELLAQEKKDVFWQRIGKSKPCSG